MALLAQQDGCQRWAEHGCSLLQDGGLPRTEHHRAVFGTHCGGLDLCGGEWGVKGSKVSITLIPSGSSSRGGSSRSRSSSSNRDSSGDSNINSGDSSCGSSSSNISRGSRDSSSATPLGDGRRRCLKGRRRRVGRGLSAKQLAKVAEPRGLGDTGVGPHWSPTVAGEELGRLLPELPVQLHRPLQHPSALVLLSRPPHERGVAACSGPVLPPTGLTQKPPLPHHLW